MKFHSFRITLVNPHDRPAWFILPDSADQPLPKSGVFSNKKGAKQPFLGKEYTGKGGSVIEVVMIGYFKAFRLPANGRVELDGYTVEAWKDVDEIVVLEASDFTVNGKTLLEKWLPYGTTSGKKVKVEGKRVSIDWKNWKNLDWDEKKFRNRTDYPKEIVEEVKATGIRNWIIKFQPKR